MELELLLQTTSDIVIGLSANHLIVSFNRSAEKFYNFKSKNAIGKDFFEVFASQGFRSPINSDFFKTPANTEIYSETLNGHGKTCSLKWVICSINANQSKTRLLLIGKDASFKATAIADNLVNIINCTPGSLYWKDRNGHYLGCNQFMVDTSGLKTVNDIVGKTDFDLWPNYAPKLSENDQYVMQTGKTLMTEEAVRIPNGKLMYFAGVKMPLRDESNNITGVIGNSLDITALKLAEQELRIAKIEAEKSNQLKTEFIRNMEHDIRTPFSGIYAMTKILQEQEADKEKKYLLGTITDCAKQLLDYCNGILDFSKLESGNLPLLSKKFNLRQLINDVATMERLSAEAKNLSFITEYPDDISEFFISDAFRIQRILINLVSNAVKFTEKGYIKISVKIAKTIDAKHVIAKIYVEDTGIGIPQDKHTAIYEKFNRLNPSNQGFYKGCGLGLTIVKQLIEELNGEIELYSEPNKGSKFICLLPLKLPLINEAVAEL
jgi:two-component system aerobic respiration control sensor histidine kinase ArcB